MGLLENVIHCKAGIAIITLSIASCTPRDYKIWQKIALSEKNKSIKIKKSYIKTKSTFFYILIGWFYLLTLLSSFYNLYT